MAEIVSEDSGVGRSMEGTQSSQGSQSGEALIEWRSSEQVENGTPSVSPPYWDTDDDDDGGPKPSALYGKYTWKIEKFSQISKRELRSNAFEVGGYKWYILIYPQGCDVCNHLSLFLCVANHDKLLPGWSHFAQFTIAVVNKDPKKSKYSDTLHRFWKKEHDWGWKKFMELSKIGEGFIDSDDNLIIKAQVQVIREKADRPFRCLDCQYRRELVRVYLTNVEQICRRFVEERRSKLGKLIEDKARWSSFCAFWLGMDQNSRRCMSRERADVILKVVVKHFFIEKEVTSTLVMDSLYSGLRALEGQSRSKKTKAKIMDAEEMPAPIVCVEKDMFMLVDDVLLLLERAALEPLPPKDEKGPQNRMKDGSSGEDFNKEAIERDERRLTELGRRTVEIFALAHIFSNKIEVAYQEAIALKRQEELIREEEEAWLAESEQKAKRAAEKEKKSKKKQGKQKRGNRKGKEKRREEKVSAVTQDRHHEENHIYEGKGSITGEVKSELEKSDVLEDVSDASDSMDASNEVLQPDSEDRETSPVNWDTDTSEAHPPSEPRNGTTSGPLSVPNGHFDKKNQPVMDDSSSTCSTDSVPSVVLTGSYKGSSVVNYQNQKSPTRGKNNRGKSTISTSSLVIDKNDQPLTAAEDARDQHSIPESSKAVQSESNSIVSSLQKPKKLLESQVHKKEEVLPMKKTSKSFTGAEHPKERTATVLSPPRTPPTNLSSTIQTKSDHRVTPKAETVPTAKSYSNGPVAHKSNTQKAIAAKLVESAAARPVPIVSRPSSAPLIPPSRPAPPVVSVIQTTASLARSVSLAGRLGPDPSPATRNYVPQSYRNVTVGNAVVHPKSASPGVTQPAVNPPDFLSQSSGMIGPTSGQSGYYFALGSRDAIENAAQRNESSQSLHREPSSSMVDDSHTVDRYMHFPYGFRNQQPGDIPASTSGRLTHGALADDFPHLDIINDLLNDEQASSSARRRNDLLPLNRQYSFPSDINGLGETGACRFERLRNYHDDRLSQAYNSHFDLVSENMPYTAPLAYMNGQIDGLISNNWPMPGLDLSLLAMRNPDTEDVYQYFDPELLDPSLSINGYAGFRSSSRH